MNITLNDMTKRELLETGGGHPILFPIITGLSISLGNHLLNNWDSFKAGLFGEPDPARHTEAR